MMATMQEAEQFWPEILSFCQDLCDHISPQLLQDFGRVRAAEKSDGSLVTRADQWADAEICRAIATRFPEHGILSEENNHVFPDKDWCWVIDPIDGTTDFTRGIPIWATSLGLLYQGTPVFGFVNVPTLRQAFYGYWTQNSNMPSLLQVPAKAYCKGNVIGVDVTDLSQSHLFSFCTRSISTLQKEKLRTQKFPCKIRMLGASTYNLLTVAMGATVGGVEATPKVWDIAAVWAITRAAGATWVSLHETHPFPLVPERSYREQSYPTLLVARAELLPIFRPFVQGIGHANPS